MIRKIGLVCIAGVVSLFAAKTIMGQTTSSTGNATATPASVSSSAPSSFKIRANILAQKQAAILAQIEVARRCIKTSGLPTVLRDPEGNLRTVPKTDIVNCTRTLNSLRRQLASLARESAKLSADAEGAAFRLESLQQQARVRARLKGQPNQ
jgi:hypothetical protein